MWEWSRKREEAAGLVAEDRLTNEQIARSVGVTRKAVDIWRTKPEFAARVRELVEAKREAVKAEGIANAQNRIADYAELRRRMQQVIDERAADKTLEGVPGGKSGLIVRQYKMVGGKEPMVREEFVVDTGLVSAFEANNKQAAQELGQWVEAREHRFASLPTDKLLEVAQSLGLAPSGTGETPG